MRVDKWLWHARFFKTRGQAAALVADGRLRVNGSRTSKPAATVRPGDTLTFPQAGRIRVVRIERVSTRRGPAAEAAMLYSDLDPSPMERATPSVERHGRPDRKERRTARLSRQSGLIPGRPPNS